MDSECSRKKRTNIENEEEEEEEEVDRLSGLPDDIIHKILSFNSFKDAVRTSAVSSRWRYIWTSVSCLDFSSKDFSTLDEFSKHVRQILSCRNKQTEVSSLSLNYHGKAVQPFVKRLLNYAFSHNIQQLNVSYESLRDSIAFPLALYSSQSRSLKHLIITMKRCYEVKCNSTTLSNLELPALTTLYLDGLTFWCDNNSDSCVALFSNCPNLKNLTVSHCKTEKRKNFSICHPQLSNLTLKNGFNHANAIDVVAPQLENLIIKNSSRETEHVISTPNLASLGYHGYGPLHVSTDGFHSLKEADICVSDLKNGDAHQMVCMFQQLHNVKFLKLNLEIVEFLSSFVELISHQPSPFVNLNSLTIFPKNVSGWNVPKETLIVSDEVEHYLLDGSPAATFMMVYREEITAKEHMAQLQALLVEAKASLETRTDMGRVKKAPLLSMDEITNIHKQDGPSQQFRESMARIESWWEDLSVDVEQRKKKVFPIISKLQQIQTLLIKLPPKKKALYQPSFSSLCAESNFVMNKIAHGMKMRCDATTMQSTYEKTRKTKRKRKCSRLLANFKFLNSLYTHK